MNKVKAKKIINLLIGNFIGVYNKASYLKPDAIITLNNNKDLYIEDNNKEIQKGIIEVSIFKNVILFPEFSVAAKKDIIENTFVNETLIDRHFKNKFLKKYYISKINTEFVTSIDKCFSASNYFHILIDTLPRLWALRHPFFEDKEITLLLPHERNNDILTLIRSLIPENVIINKASKYKRYFCKNYIHLPYLSQPRIKTNNKIPSAGYIPNEYLDFLKNSAISQFNVSETIVPKKNILISREDAKIRRVINEKELLEALKPYHFEKHTLSGKTLKQQIEIFRSAKNIICMHGAALTNLLWVNPKQCRIIEIFPVNSESKEFYSKHAKTLDLNYNKIEMNSNNINSDIIVGIESILKLLNQ
ncbi:glycosyltransferase family 61 protein [Pseudotamlana agarivorans]|uniref:glycosyltransferase family 61 protein n=1 Tax=Pseudotamlana agarivorans TaxID=481183 RepID=UPI0008359C92|nr:glycosyltransferase family 61 protein [Tamlana agarivorans]